MSKYIIAERWTTPIVNVTNPYIPSGIFNAPGATYNSNKLSATGMWKDPYFGSGEIQPNAFQQGDVVLVRRFRLWSPAAALGLCGGSTTPDNVFRLHAVRLTGVATLETFVCLDPMVLGEWVDCNQTIEAAALAGGPGPWTLGLEFDTMTLDSSRMNPALLGAGVSLLNFVCQVDLAHSLPGVHV